MQPESTFWGFHRHVWSVLGWRPEEKKVWCTRWVTNKLCTRRLGKVGKLRISFINTRNFQYSICQALWYINIWIPSLDKRLYNQPHTTRFQRGWQLNLYMCPNGVWTKICVCTSQGICYIQQILIISESCLCVCVLWWGLEGIGGWDLKFTLRSIGGRNCSSTMKLEVRQNMQCFAEG